MDQTDLLFGQIILQPDQVMLAVAQWHLELIGLESLHLDQLLRQVLVHRMTREPLSARLSRNPFLVARPSRFLQYRLRRPFL